MIDWWRKRVDYNLENNTHYKTTDDFLLGLYLAEGSETAVRKILGISKCLSFKRLLMKAKNTMVTNLREGRMIRWTK